MRVQRQGIRSPGSHQTSSLPGPRRPSRLSWAWNSAKVRFHVASEGGGLGLPAVPAVTWAVLAAVAAMSVLAMIWRRSGIRIRVDRA